MTYYQKGPDYYVDAMNALEKARALGATNEHLFFYAGVMYDALGLPDYASNELTKYLHHHPDDYETMVRLANVYFGQKRYEEAEALYKKALHEWPKDPTAWFNFAIVSREKGQYAVALKSLQQVRRMTGSLPDGGFYEEGVIYQRKGEEEKALEDFRQELNRNPDHLPSLEALEQDVRKKGDAKQARELQKHIAALKKQAR